MKWSYCFSVWPDETWKREKRSAQSFFQLFQLFGRVEMTFTPAEFEVFRSGLSHHGLTLREIERVPFHMPEAIL